MTKVADILSTVAMGVCIGYVLICWVADLGRVGMMHPGVRYHLLFPAGLVTTIVGFVVALIGQRQLSFPGSDN